MDRMPCRPKRAARRAGGAALALCLLGPAPHAQPGFGSCFPPAPPPPYEDAREYELAIDQYFDEVSAFYACNSERLRTLRTTYTAELEAEIARLRAFYAEMVRDEEAILREDRALVDREYREALEAYEALRRRQR